MPRDTRRTIFAVARGQYGNIGDVMLRRQLLDWVRDAGPLHVYVGDAPPGYAEGLALHAEDVTYRSLWRWYAAALRAAVAGRGAYVFKPGEIQLTLLGLKEHLVMLPLLAVLRVRGGRAVRVGVGTRGFAAVPRALVRPSVALSDLTLWRDDATAAYMGSGAVMPDLAFGEGADDAALARAGEDVGGRDVLVVSLRGDGRPFPSRAALAGIAAYARAHHLEVWAVTQVQVDDERTAALAEALGGRALRWGEARGHDAAERELRALYARAAVALSDRLHVLVAAATEGAVPVAGAVVASEKIARHLSTIGVDDVGLDLVGDDADAVQRRLEALAARRGEVADALLRAREDLAGRRADVLAVLTDERARGRGGLGVGGRVGGAPRGLAAREAPDGGLEWLAEEVGPMRRLTSYHLGRVGDVAGGMTQVLNGYLEHRFEHVGVEVITTRGDPHDTRAAVVASVLAARRIALLPWASVVVAHVSERGSFLREGGLMRLAHARGLATVAHVHGSSFASFAAARPRLVRWVLRAADRVIVLSEESREVALGLLGADAPSTADRVVLVPNAIAGGADVPLADKDDVVVFGGSVSHRKGIDVLQRAWGGVDAPGWELVVAGPVTDAHLVRDDVPGMRLAGSLPHAQLMTLLDRSRVAVLPSRDEALPMFVLEAMARDNAVVATDVGGVAEVLAGGAGTVVPAGDHEALQQALQDVISCAGLRERLATAGRAAFEERYRADTVFSLLEQVWTAAYRRSRVRRR